jgi:uncharacterized protein YjbI with pentapeptide repeats/vacuolar-type H+-ATPase subunit E/Vma4
MPNIEAPDNLITSTDARPMPAGFAAFRPEWQQRLELMGSYDEQWKNEHFPDYAPDLDWNHFNAAPRDQWIDGFWPARETFELTHMHPQQAVLKGRLPGFRVRSFVGLEQTAGLQIREIDMQAETVALFPEVQSGIMLYRGTFDIDSDDAEEIEHILCALENIAEPRDAAYYQQAMHDRLNPRHTFKFMLTTQDLLPDTVRCGYAQILDAAGMDGENELVKNVKARAEQEKNDALKMVEAQKQSLKQQLEAMGIDPGPYLQKLDDPAAGEVVDPQLKAIQDLIEKAVPGAISGVEIDISRLDFDALREIQPLIDEFANAKKQAVVDDLQQQAAQAGDDQAGRMLRERIEHLLEGIEQPQPLPRPAVDQILQVMQQQLQDLAQTRLELIEQGFDEGAIPEPTVSVEQIREQTRQAIAGSRESYRLGAQLIEGRPPHEVPQDIVQHRLQKKLDKGESLAGGDWAGADFSGMTLNGRDLSHCYLEYADFSNAQLEGVNLEGAILTHALCDNTLFENCNMARANLGGSRFPGARFYRCDLREAILGRAQMSGAQLDECNLQDASFLETVMREARLRACNTRSANFLELDFTDAALVDCQFIECNFVKCDLTRCDCSGANLSSSNFVESTLDGARFHACRMHNVRLPGGSTARQCNFSGANLDQSNFRDVDASESNFEQASFQQADFSGANLQKAKFYAANGKRALLIKADLAGADLMSLNLMEGTLTKARLTQADLSHANLYSVDMREATIGETRFDGANLDLTILEHEQAFR